MTSRSVEVSHDFVAADRLAAYVRGIDGAVYVWDTDRHR